jgi:hypothetical protein
MMNVPSDVRRQLLRMEEARRQTQHQLGMIERQITRRMTAMIPVIGRKQSGYRRGKAPDPGAFIERYRSNLAAITAERQPEIDALSHKLARQDQAIARIRQNIGICWSWAKPREAEPLAGSRSGTSAREDVRRRQRACTFLVVAACGATLIGRAPAEVMVTCRSVPVSMVRPSPASLRSCAVLNRRPFASRPRSAPRGGRRVPHSTWRARARREG